MLLTKPEGLKNLAGKPVSGRAFNDYVLAACIAAGALLYLSLVTQIRVVSIGDPIGPRLLPIIVGCGLLLSAVMLVFETLKQNKAANPIDAGAATSSHASKHGYLFLCGIVVIMAGYYAVFNYLGYLISTSVFMMLLLTLLNRGKWILNIALSLGFTLAAYICFSKFLTIALPAGLFGF